MDTVFPHSGFRQRTWPWLSEGWLQWTTSIFSPPHFQQARGVRFHTRSMRTSMLVFGCSLTIGQTLLLRQGREALPHV
jgi:hypothetical protein